MTTWWCEYALIGGAVEHGVTVRTAHGRFTSVEANTAPAIEASRLSGLTVPGFANTHSHAFHRALRSRVQAERGTFWTWREIMYRAAERLNPDNYHRLARAVFAEMAVAGMTVVGEFHYVHHQIDGTPYDSPNVMGEALLAAASEAGIRITLLDALYLHGGLEAEGHVAPSGAQLRYRDTDAHRWAERVGRLSDGDRHRIGAAIHSVRAVNPDSMQVVSAWASQRDAPLHAHVSEQRAENDRSVHHYGRTPTALLELVGALETNFTAVHATHLTDHDLELLATNRCSVCMCPTTERDLGDGIGLTSELVAKGVPLSLGSDSHAVIDQMAEARAVELNERLRSEKRGTHSATELMHMATTAGHRSLGWDDAGAIAVGLRADLVTIGLDSERLAGAASDLLIEAAVFASTTSDITSVIVDGEALVSGGNHVHIDVAAELQATIEELLS
ncbi:MAG: formimidoylglutamate deiminase [Acidimicrobiia bacterium]|nr:formimidoylglutamate deiminase [Acidimicrobiia bacterium]